MSGIQVVRRYVNGVVCTTQIKVGHKTSISFILLPIGMGQREMQALPNGKI